MNPILLIQTLIDKIHTEKRVCPKCGMKQSVSAGRGKAVYCKFCGAAIPPAGKE